MKYEGIMALLNLISSFAFILLTFFCLQSLRLDRYISSQRQRNFSFLIILISVAIGYACSSFFIDFINNVRNLSYLL
ncbi:DUF1146 family protein [Liquorilactobacillus satsumensis]|nr:DUF1146 family protein [Liquorilactobacillus satsumensis]MCC7667319.1 DUF1146 domain-containing protein [Liquorilactobacillus satsumensis]MCP9312380.1 DUF1146 family protein [Liquorilactobacillus satsumensis]MCP9327645.1 DUF1146 family protein [Liquorilactobacillus satsumensis]MCP9357083.1 DUF1146 family protein [Liquorilactobacillus satsumensis]MCP9359616.1 DUF1146 family protein [Liquorilactobacillus satsumensis]